MYPELYQYLLLHHSLPVPGIGTFLLQRTAASADFPNKQLHPPAWTFAYQPAAPVPAGRFFTWLGNRLGISQMDAVIRFNDFAFEWKKQVEKGHTIDWSGVGTIKKGLAGDIKFTPSEPAVFLQPVAAVKVLRDKARHMVRVGEEEKTSVEMEALLAREAVRRSYWWVAALAIGLLGLVFTGWYFSQNGISVSTTSNTKKLVPAEAVTTSYKELR